MANAVHNGLTVIPETHASLHGEKVAFGTLVQLMLEGRLLAEIQEAMAFCAAVGLPLTLQALGIAALSPDQAQAVTMRAVAPVESSQNEPFIVEWRVVKDAYPGR